MKQKNALFVCLLLAGVWTTSFGQQLLTAPSLSPSQQLWPGDINNNGVVNHIDMLYWGVARDAQGPARSVQSNTWTGHTPPAPWASSFPGGLNYCQADANGQGKVDKEDRKAIHEINYGQTHGTVIPDAFLEGDPATDPTLLLVPAEPIVSPGSTTTVPLSLGDASHPVTSYFGLAFTFYFDPGLVADETRSLFKPKNVKFKLHNNTWINDSGSAKSEVFMRLDNGAGTLDVVILRKGLGTSGGFGEIGEFIIVMEDVVLLEDTPLNISIDNIILVGDNLMQYPVAGSSTQIMVESSGGLNRPQGPQNSVYEPAPSGTFQVEAAPTDSLSEPAAELLAESLPDAGMVPTLDTPDIRIFPNPVIHDAVWVNLTGEGQALIKLELYGRSGRLLFSREMQEQHLTRQEINMKRYPPGVYLLRVYTTDKVSSHLLSK